MMNILEAKNITKIFPGVVALNNVSLTAQTGKIHGIVGENGAGKSTLIKVLTGIYKPEKGTILIKGVDVKTDPHLFDAVGYAPQELDHFPNMTVADNLFMPYDKTGINSFFLKKNDLYRMAKPWLQRMNINVSPDQLVRDISVSEQQLLQIARVLVNEKAEILLLDEPTTSLTVQDTEHLFTVLREVRNSGKSIIFISHKLDEVFSICDDITVLRDGNNVAQSDSNQVSIDWTIRNMVGRDVSSTEVYQSERVSNEVIFQAKNLCGDSFQDVSFEVKKGEILGFSGLVGSGRSEVMQAILGILPLYSGSITLKGKPWKYGQTDWAVDNGFIYLPEERKTQGIFSNLSVKINTVIALYKKVIKKFVVSGQVEKSITEDIIDAYEIKTSSIEQQIQYLSGGNQQKVIIGRVMYGKPEILVFDEPTKGIDVGTKTSIYKLMKKLAEEDQVAIILISSEMEEIMRCSNRILCMYEGRINGEFQPNVDQQVVLNCIMGQNV